jgi:hypothetical protein
MRTDRKVVGSSRISGHSGKGYQGIRKTIHSCSHSHKPAECCPILGIGTESKSISPGRDLLDRQVDAGGQEENSSEASCRNKVRAPLNHDAANAIVANTTLGPYQPTDGRTPAFAVKILEEQQGRNESRKLDQFTDERPNPLRFTEGHLESGCIRKQS